MEERRRHRGHHGRKERVLHTRISEQLSEDIRRLADDLRVPASNLVRNVLEEVFTVVESVSDDVGDLFEDVLEEADAARERIRRRHRGFRPHRGHRGARDERSRSWADVAEAELRRDEQAERTPEPPSPPREPSPPPREPSSPPRERPSFPEVIGWQPLVLNQRQDCGDCGRSIPPGSRAYVGMTEKGLSRNTLCRDCLQRR